MLVCDHEGGVNAMCDGSSGVVVCTCPGNYSLVNDVCQCKREKGERSDFIRGSM